MGRYKRKKHLYNLGNGTASTTQSSNGNKNGTAEDDTTTAESSSEFTNREKVRLRAYLEEYQKCAIARCSIRACPRKQHCNVKGINLPKLTKKLLEGPYLALPSALTFRQRQFVHECCIDLHLYHCGLGSRRQGALEERRWIAVSIYYDVFEQIDEFAQPPYIGFHRKYKPWYCRHENYAFRDESTKSIKAHIQTLIDQPSSCLREELDTINFVLVEGKDLSHMPPIGESDTDWMLVDTPNKMRQCIQELEQGQPTELAFDVEAYNPSKYCQQTCLLQITTNLRKEYVIDPLAEGVWDEVVGLQPFFSNPNIVKIGHSIGGLDAKCLHRDFGIYICNVFDTYEAARVLNLPSHGLAAVCDYYGVDTTEYTALKAIYQTTDWRQRPLTNEMILYGRYDIHFLVQLRQLMMRDLTHFELFSSGGDEEGKLVAESLAVTLQRIHDFEDGIEFEEDGDGIEFETASEFDDDDDDDQPTPTATPPSPTATPPMNGNHHDGKNIDFKLEKTSSESFSDAQEEEDEDGLDKPIEDDDDDDDDVMKTKIATVDVLRMQPRLMRVLSLSQDRCLDLWTVRPEPHYRNLVFLAHIKKAKTNKHKNGAGPQPLTQSQIHLYEDLVRLRKNIALKEQCLPGFVCSLDDLARIAIGRPTCVEALRTISYFLPESLGDVMVEQIFALTKRSLRTDRVGEQGEGGGGNKSPLDGAVRRYHHSRKNKQRALEIAGKVVLASAVVGALYVVAVTISRRKRK